jgi:pSer/pThr/pTyr-binding forkhead associated (FHA) protein
MAGYETPAWGKLPTEDNNLFKLEVLKSGQIVEVLKLHGNNHFVLGRQPDICDFCLEHTSISRKHAVLQYRDDNALMLINFGGEILVRDSFYVDCDSLIFYLIAGNGSYINKKACSSGVYHRVYVGDVIKFGESTRLYLVEGPEEQRPGEHDSANMRAYRSHLSDHSKKIEKDKENAASDGVGWGFREDAVNEEYEEEGEEEEVELPDYIKNDEHYDRKYGEKFSSTLSDADVSEKDQKLLEKVRKHERKIRNMQEEISKIYQKEGKQDEGLTAGQTAAVERNDKRIEVLKAELAGLEAQIRGKQAQRSSSAAAAAGSKSQRGGVSREDEDEDEPLDTTADTVDPSTNWRVKRRLQQAASSGTQGGSGGATSVGASLTFDGLKSEWDSKSSEVEALEGEAGQLRTVISNCAHTPSAAPLDDLEAYMRDSQVQEARVRLGRVEGEVVAGRAALRRLSRLMKLAAPALASLHTSKASREKAERAASSPATADTAGVKSEADANVAVVAVADDVKPEVVIAGSSINTNGQIKAEHVSPVDISNSSNIRSSSGSSSSGNSSSGDSSERNREVDAEDGFVSRTAFHMKGSSGVHSGAKIKPIDFSKNGTADTASKRKIDETDPVAEEKEKETSGSGSGEKHNQRAAAGPPPRPLVGPSSSPSSPAAAVTAAPPPKRQRQPRNRSLKRKQQAAQETSVASSSAPPSYSSGAGTLQGGDTVWCPPKNQCGDGKTSLNAKYGY